MRRALVALVGAAICGGSALTAQTPKGSPAAPRLGEHTAELLHELGYDAAAIERLRQDKVL